MRTRSDKPKSVYYFGTCLVDAMYPDAGMAGIKLLQREGLRVVFPQNQSCCGQPAYLSGFRKEALAVARKQLDTFPENIPVVAPSGSCAGMMRCHYPKLFENDPDETRAQQFSARVHELSEFLVHVLKVRLTDLGPPIRVTWHSSCHAMREAGIVEDSKSLLRRLENVTLVPLDRETDCCGFGGTFSVKQPLLSKALVQDKINDIAETGAQKVISGDCGCLMNIAGAMNFQGLPIPSQHLAEFLWERTNA